MEEGFVFFDLKYSDLTPVKDSLFICVNESDCRIYYKPFHKTEKHGFEFVVTDFWSSEILKEGEDCYMSETFTVDVIAKGNAYGDDIRHMWIGEEGYINYPDCEKLSTIFKKLNELRLIYCWDVE